MYSQSSVPEALLRAVVCTGARPLVAALLSAFVSLVSAATPGALLQSDLAARIVDQPDPADSGGQLSLRFELMNLGPSTEPDACLEGQLPFEFHVVHVQASQGQVTYDPSRGSLSAQFGQLRPGIAFVDVLAIVDPAAFGQFETSCFVIGANFDPDQANNGWVETTTIRPTCVCASLLVHLSQVVGGVAKPLMLAVGAAQNGNDLDLEIRVGYIVELACGAGNDGCAGSVTVSVKGANWSVAGGAAAPDSEEVVANVKKPADKDVFSPTAECDKTSKFGNTMSYKAKFKNSAKPLTGEVTITWTIVCNGATTTKTMMIKVDTNKTGATANYDYAKSDFDGDGKLNKDDKFPFDPAKS